MIKLIAIDLDGTLLNHKKELPSENVEAIQKAVAAGIKVVLCTGRPLPGTRPIFEQLGLTNEYLIVNNGCSTYATENWKLIDDFHLTAEDIRLLSEVSRKEKGVQLTIFDEKEHYYVIDEEPSDIVVQDASLVYLEPTSITTDDLLALNDIQFQAMFLAEESRLDSFQERYEAELSERFSTVRSQPIIFEAMPKGATKAAALKALADRLAISSDEIMALGDANNDIEMLTLAGYSVAMGNSPEHIKSLAKYVTGTNDAAGVAQAIYQYALHQD